MALLALPVTELHPAEVGKLLTVDRTENPNQDRILRQSLIVGSPLYFGTDGANVVVRSAA
jgi:hypothetical protein